MTLIKVEIDNILSRVDSKSEFTQIKVLQIALRVQNPELQLSGQSQLIFSSESQTEIWKSFYLCLDCVLLAPFQEFTPLNKYVCLLWYTYIRRM